ncbi:4Fe-4S binding protein [Pseudopelagicola sp. nBUS_20]|uniref:4Fe-4S binding protein n=1 Tax=Pseudopelagicola sp. nBUS_20 TaxID=3395317 RepID=UPI003EB81116
MSKSLILCDCSKSSKLNTEALEASGKVACSKVHSSLCTFESDAAKNAIATGNSVIGCQQERAFFTELAADLEVPEPCFVDLRDRAGWSEQASTAGPKMAALLADALRESPPTKTFDIVSEGICLVLGENSLALTAAAQLASFLSITVLLESATDLPLDRSFDTIVGQLKSATGALGNFDVRIDELQQIKPGGRSALGLAEPRNGAETNCDIILDLRRTAPLFPAHTKREGYLRADPKDPAAVYKAILQASHLVGTFEKPLYLSLDPTMCAHSRAEQIGCSKCLNICPTSAIKPAGDHVDIDPNICAGCGSCATLCPSGAISYDDPAVDFLFKRIAGMAEAYLEAGGDQPRLLVHDRDYGAEIIALSARFDRGLPADVIPMDLEQVSGFGHAEMLTALATGFAAVDILVSPKTEKDALEPELKLAQALTGKPQRLRLIEPIDPSDLCTTLYETKSEDLEHVTPILPLGTRRQVTRLAVKALQPQLKEPIPLPRDAPYGAILIDTEACTLCLSCASLCPAGALGDNPDMPQLRFQEDACLQCGLCANVCPEKAIRLQPQFDTSEAVFSQRVIHEEDPFECVECGQPFGVKSTVEHIIEKLAGKHAMFDTSDATRMIKMCDNCRVNAQFHSEKNPFSSSEKPRVRTTEDYLSKRRDH